MLLFRHCNILSCLRSFVLGTHVVIVTPWMSLGSARDVLDVHFAEGLPETAIAFILQDVLQALKYLHSKVSVVKWSEKKDVAELILSLCTLAPHL